MTYVEPINLTSPELLFSYANTTLNGIFGIGILLMVYFVVLIVMLRVPNSEITSCVTVSGLVGAVLSVFLLVLGVLSEPQFIIMVIIFAVSAVSGYVFRYDRT